MSIDRVYISRSQAAQQTEPARNVGNDRKGQTGTDSVALSAKAAGMNRLAETVENSQSQRLDKVRAQLKSGVYRVSAKDLAKKLIESNRK